MIEATKSKQLITNEIIAMEDAHTSGAYSKRGIALVRGNQEFVFDSEGRKYVDFIAGHGSVVLGHCNPRIVETIKSQSQILSVCNESFYNDKRAELTETLCKIAPQGLEKVFLTNSGTEAVEAAFKLARSTTGKKEIIAVIGGFHGRTLGALSLTWRKDFKEPFIPLLSDVKHVRYDNSDEIKKAISSNTAAVIIEPVLGEGGVRIPHEGYLKEVREVCDETGVLMVLDEVQTSFGRTGAFFACNRENVSPDIMCLAKGIANGFPMGAMLSRGDLKFKPKTHGSTFAGNPLACAISLAVIEELQTQNLPQRSKSEGRRFVEKLQSIAKENKKIAEVRGIGLMVALELKAVAQPFLQKMQEDGLLALPSGETILRFLPPLNTQQSSFDSACETIERVLAE